MAAWLNGTFGSLDGGVFAFMHALAENAGGFLTPLCKIVTLIGEKGIIFFIISLILCLFAKTRKAGCCGLCALVLGAVIGLVLKALIARERPYYTQEYYDFWQFVGGESSSSYCFPSGHVTMVTAFAVVLFVSFSKKWSYVGFFGVILMSFVRVYLVAHYFTDVIGGLLVGGICGIAAILIIKFIYSLLEKYKDKKFCKFLLNADVRNLFAKNRTEDK